MKPFLRACAELPCAALALLLYPLFALAGRISTGRRRTSRALPRLLWGATPILTIATGSEAMRRRGYESLDLVFRPYSIYSQFTVSLERWARFLPVRVALPFLAFLWALPRFDVFFGFYDGGLLTGTILAPLEWKLLRWAGKLSILSAYGSDVRTEKATRALGEFCCCTDCDKRVLYCACRDEIGLPRVARARRDAAAWLSMGDMIEYTPDSRNDLFYWPIEVAALPAAEAAAHDGPVRVVHAANHRMFKGTRFLEQAIAELRAEGLAIELDIVERVTNDEVRRRTARADIVAEQFLIGWFGYFAVEAMALGKPVISFVRKPEYLPSGVDCPVVSADPRTLKETLRALALDPCRRQALGEAGRRFAERIFSLEAFGARMDEFVRSLWFPHPIRAAATPPARAPLTSAALAPGTFAVAAPPGAQDPAGTPAAAGSAAR